MISKVMYSNSNREVPVWKHSGKTFFIFRGGTLR